MNDRWKPDEKKVAKKKEYLESLFSEVNKKPDDNFLTDCAKISVFLEDMDAVISQLKKLSCMLKEKSDEANLVAGAKGSVKVFRNMLEKELGDMGFHPQFGQVVRAILDADFLATVSKGLLLKDSAFRQGNHGEFTHPIQWILIDLQNKESSFLSEKTIEVFKKLGNPNTLFNNPNNSGAIGQNLWDEVVDAMSSTHSYFRSPETLNLYILENPQEFGCLSEVLESRAKKKPILERNFFTPEKQQKYEKTTVRGLFEPKVSANDTTIHNIEQEPTQKKP